MEQHTDPELLIEKSALLDQSADAILSRDVNDRIRFWNKGAERLFGWSAEEAVGRLAPDLLMPEPDAYRRARQALFAAGSWTGDIVKRNRRGEALIVECHWTLIRAASGDPRAILAVDADVTQARHAEAQLRLAATVFDAAAEAIVITDAVGVILQVNRALTAQTLRSLLAVRQAGFTLSVDDFGTGYSSLSYLTRYPLAKIKIDLSFVRDMGAKPSARAVVAATLSMARDLGMRSLAEGVETSGQRDMLLAMGCELGQGYLFDRPLPGAQFSGKWLARGGGAVDSMANGKSA